MKVSSAEINQQNVEFHSLNLFVGSNNAGKSTLLKELHGAVMNGIVQSKDAKWLDSVTIEIANLQDTVKSVFSKSDISQIETFEAHRIAEEFGFQPFRSNISQNLRNYSLPTIFNTIEYRDNLSAEINIPKLNSTTQINTTSDYATRRFIADIEVLSEFCDSRLANGFNTTITDILQAESDQSPVRRLRENPDLLKSLQTNVLRVFGAKIGFDNLEQGQKPLRIIPARKFPKNIAPKELAALWRDKSPTIDSQGDGIRAYLKLALSLLDPFSRVIFIDEPETFLHPPQRRALGGLISDMAKRHEKQVFIATHDAEFIRGLLNTGNDVKVLNLKNKSGSHEVVEMDLKDIKSVLDQKGNRLKERAPILNESLLNSLFYEKTILVENENDRMFYEYYATLRHGGAIQNKRFIGLRGIDEVLNLAEKLYGLGVNVGVIVDIDFILHRYAPKYIKDARQDIHTAHVAIREEFNKLSENCKKDLQNNMKKNGLRALSNNALLGQVDKLIDDYSAIGIYIPKVGELESWTKTSKNNLSQMLRIVEDRNPRDLNKFMKVVLS